MNLKNIIYEKDTGLLIEKNKTLDNEREYTPILKPRNIFKTKNGSFVGQLSLKNS